MGIAAYLIHNEDREETLKLEIGNIAEMMGSTQAGHDGVSYFLNRVRSELPYLTDAQLARCVVRRYSKFTASGLCAHRIDGPALQISDVETGFVYYEEHCRAGKLHRKNEPAIMLNDTRRISLRHFIDGEHDYRKDSDFYYRPKPGDPDIYTPPDQPEFHTAEDEPDPYTP